MIAQVEPISTKQLSADGFCWNQYSPRVGTITNEIRHFSRVCYFQFPDWNSAHNFRKHITDKRLCTRAQVRQAERFTTGYKVKAWEMSSPTLYKLLQRAIASARPSAYHCHKFAAIGLLPNHTALSLCVAAA